MSQRTGGREGAPLLQNRTTNQLQTQTVRQGLFAYVCIAVITHTPPTHTPPITLQDHLPHPVVMIVGTMFGKGVRWLRCMRAGACAADGGGEAEGIGMRERRAGTANE